jgi:hypothetical protein
MNERPRDAESADADNTESTGAEEAVKRASSRPGYRADTPAPSTTSKRLSRDDLPEPDEGSQG